MKESASQGRSGAGGAQGPPGGIGGDGAAPGPATVASPPRRPPRTAVLTCAVLEDEIAQLREGLDHIVLVEILQQGLHNTPDELRRRLQAAIEQVETTTDAEVIVLGYGLCSRGIEGLHTTRCTLVVPRAHDYITLLLGDKDRYARYVAEHPGTYWYSVGWNRHTQMPGRERYEQRLAEYREKYGEDNAAYLMETEQHWFKTYRRASFVDLTVGESGANREAAAFTQRCAAWLDWDFDHQQGDPDLVRALLDGRWDDERFLVLPPGQTPRLTADDRIIEACPVEASDEA